jgi:hypothetical protein
MELDIDQLETDTSLCTDGQYLVLIQPTGWPIFRVIERFGGMWVVDDEDWDVKGFVKLPDEGIAMNYINGK